MRKRKDTTPSLEERVPKRLTEVEINDRARRMARLQVKLRALEREKKAAVSRVTSEIKELAAEVDSLAQEIDAGEELLKQGDLFVDGRKAGEPKPETAGAGEHAPSAVRAAEVLTEVATRAEGPLPSEPHLYTSSKPDGSCDVCGSEPFDPIHGAPASVLESQETPTDAGQAETPAGASTAPLESTEQPAPPHVLGEASDAGVPSCACAPKADPAVWCEDHRPLSMRVNGLTTKLGDVIDEGSVLVGASVDGEHAHELVSKGGDIGAAIDATVREARKKAAAAKKGETPALFEASDEDVSFLDGNGKEPHDPAYDFKESDPPATIVGGGTRPFTASTRKGGA